MVKGSLNRKKVYAEVERYVEEYGNVPTCPELRRFIGKGSMGTIHKYLSDYKNELDDKDDQVLPGGSHDVKCEIPPELEKVWKSAVSTIREEIWKENEAVKNTIKAELVAKIEQLAELEASLRECRDIMNTLSDEVDSKDSEIQRLREQNIGFAEEITKAKVIIEERDSRIKELLAEAEAAKEQFDEAQRSIGRMAADIEALKEKGAKKAA